MPRHSIFSFSTCCSDNLTFHPRGREEVTPPPRLCKVRSVGFTLSLFGPF